jgi:hypothetical protein
LRFNWLDYALIGTMAAIAAVQFLRSTEDFSRILYETLFLVGAVVAASPLLRPLSELTRLSNPLLFGSVGCVLSVLGTILAAFVNRPLPFGLGLFNCLPGLLLASVCAYALGHLGLRGRPGRLAAQPRVRHGCPAFVSGTGPAVFQDVHRNPRVPTLRALEGNVDHPWNRNTHPVRWPTDRPC